MAQDPSQNSLDWEAPLNRYFLKEVADELKEKGIVSLEELVDLLYEHTERWAKQIGIDQDRANGILCWLYDRKAFGIELPPVLQNKAIDLKKSYYSDKKIELVGSYLWSEVVNPHNNQAPKRKVGDSVKGPTLVAPLERLNIPAQLNGAQGTNRGPLENCALKAKSDLEAIYAWLAARANNPNTQAAYRKEVERFLLWALLEKRMALSSLGVEECSKYLRWIEQLGRTDDKEWAKSWNQPQNTWIGPKNVLRSDRLWRPFNSALSYSSRRAASTIIRQLFSFLHKTGYLKFNPFDQISPKIPLLPGEGKPKEYADRSLSSEQWKAILDHLETVEDPYIKARLKVILLLGKGLGMRASEMLNARCGWIQLRQLENEEVYVLNIVGKGDKERRVPISEGQLEMISEYLAIRKRPNFDDPSAAMIPLLATRRIGAKAPSQEGLSRSGLYLILHDFFEDVAMGLHKEHPMDAAKLRTSSLHWLRHTFAVTSLEVMPVNIVQNAMGHASVNTTSHYIVPTEQAIAEGFKKKADL